MKSLLNKPLFNYNKLPIRTKLTIWYTISFIIVATFSFLGFFYVTQNMLRGNIDKTLKSQSDEIVKLLKDKNISPLSKGIILDSFNSTKTNFVLVVNNTGQIIAQSQSFAVDQYLLDKLLEHVRQQDFHKEFSTIEGNRFYVNPLTTDGQLDGVIIVGLSISSIQETFAVLLRVAIFILLLFALPLILFSFLEAEIFLYPLRSLANHLNRINTKNLSARVDIINPKDEIGEVSIAINQLLDRLQEGFIKERQLIHDISHQLKTPLTAIRSDIEIALSKKRSKADYQQILKDLYKDTIRMSKILKDMVNFAWASSEDQSKFFKLINISHILNEIQEIIEQLAYEKEIKLYSSIDKNMYIMGQKEKIFQTILNIMENAIKYTPKGGKIYLHAYKEQDQIKIIAKDTGIGIYKKDIPHIFERFYRGKSKISEGSGLGLSIAAAIVKAHQGSIEVASVVNKGTTFLIKLPKASPLKKANKKHKLKIKAIKFKRPNVSGFLAKYKK